jgi:hypothetical protein
MKPIYFYTTNTTTKKGPNNLLVNHYTVIKVERYTSIDIANRIAREVAAQNNLFLVGGYFTPLPYDFSTNYTVLRTPLGTKPQAYNERDLFIIDLIERGA